MKIFKFLHDTAEWLHAATTFTIIASAIGVTYAYFRDNFCIILPIVEFILILALLIILYIKHKDNPKLSKASNPSLCRTFYNKELKLVKKRFEQLNHGYLKIFGDDVRRLQKDIFTYFEKPKDIIVRAVDVTQNPEILLTREEYIKQNERFISMDGTLRRLFLINDDYLTDMKFLENLHSVIKLNRSINVDIGLLLFSTVAKENIQDFIVYSDFAVIVETRQADRSYNFGDSVIHFLKSEVDGYTTLFDSMWGNKYYNPKKILGFFENSITKDKDGKFFFDTVEFNNNLKQLHNFYMKR